MRLLCPFCQKAITVPDSEAGKAVNCTECGQQFAAPQLFSPASVPPAAPALSAPEPTPEPVVPPPVRETYVTPPDLDRPPAPPDLPAMERELSGFDRMAAVSLDPKWIRWIPAGAFFLVFVLSFLPWNGLYPGGYPAYTQNAWQGVLGWVVKDEVAEDVLKVGDKKFGDELDNRVRSSLWLLPYLLLLLPMLVLAFAGPAKALLNLKLPDQIEKFWQYRPLVLGGLAVITLMLLLAQWVTGFGLQRAVDLIVEEDRAAAMASASTPEQRQREQIKSAMRKGMFHVKTSPWLRLAVLLHVLGTMAVVGEAALLLRGRKAPPRVGIMW